MKVASGLHLVDCIPPGIVNAYLWERPDGGLTLIDAGMTNHAQAIISFVEPMGRERLDRIIVTHADIDHVGGLHQVQQWTGARVICHAVEKALLEQREQRRPNPSLVGAIYGPLYRLATSTLLRYAPVSPDELVLDGQMLPEGFQVAHVPGHSPGQIALYEPEKGILITADAISNRGNKLSRPPALFTPQMDVAEDSIRRLAGLPKIEIACFGHGPPITERAAQRLAAFAAEL
jgi:glyoxylase-like metal-dependent hydrolase (beta-lactamase superfamily II)